MRYFLKIVTVTMYNLISKKCFPPAYANKCVQLLLKPCFYVLTNVFTNVWTNVVPMFRLMFVPMYGLMFVPMFGLRCVPMFGLMCVPMFVQMFVLLCIQPLFTSKFKYISLQQCYSHVNTIVNILD